MFLLWNDDGWNGKRRRGVQFRMPKMKLPSHAESYRPPDEYLPTEEEKQALEEKEEFVPQNSIRYVRYLDTKTFSRNDSRDVWIYICVLQRFEERKKKRWNPKRSYRIFLILESFVLFRRNRCCCSRDTRVEFVLFQSLLQDSGWSLVVRTKLYAVFFFLCFSPTTHHTHNHRFDDGKRIRDDALVSGHSRKHP